MMCRPALLMRVLPHIHNWYLIVPVDNFLARCSLCHVKRRHVWSWGDWRP